jgi:hypothetical protein
VRVINLRGYAAVLDDPIAVIHPLQAPENKNWLALKRANVPTTRNIVVTSFVRASIK